MPPSEVASHRVDAGKSQLANVYARALVMTADKEGSADRVGEELFALVFDVFPQHPLFEQLLSSPRTATREKLALMDRILSPRISPTLLNFLKVVAQHNRLDCLREIAMATRERVDHLRGRLRVQVRSAEGLSDDLRKQVLEVLSRSLQKEVVLEESVDPELLGGLVVRVGDQVIDGSVSHRLESMRQDALRRTRQEIQNNSERFAAV